MSPTRKNRVLFETFKLYTITSKSTVDSNYVLIIGVEVKLNNVNIFVKKTNSDSAVMNPKLDFLRSDDSVVKKEFLMTFENPGSGH